jgi:hypothetical protein
MTSRLYSKVAAEVCEKLTPDMPLNGMKLNQILTEFGGDVSLPDLVNEYVFDSKLRRAALSLIVTHIRFQKDVSKLDFERLVKLQELSEMPVNVARQIAIILAFCRPEVRSMERFIGHRDAIIKSITFHLGNDLNSVETLFDKKESIVARACALESLFFGSDLPENDFSSLIENQNETLLNLELLRLHCLEEVRAKTPKFLEFVENFLQKKSSPIFVEAALYALIGYPRITPFIAKSLGSLLSKPLFTKAALTVIAHLPDEELKNFDSDLIVKISRNFGSCDLSLESACLNHLLLAGIPFVPDCVCDLLGVYTEFDQIHDLLRQIFFINLESRTCALNFGFLSLVLEDLVNADHISPVLQTLCVFLYNFPEGQNLLIETWPVEVLIALFDSSDLVLQFFLCLISGNCDSQSVFLECPTNGGKRLIDLVLESFSKSRACPVLLAELLAGLGRSDEIRGFFGRSKAFSKFVLRLSYGVEHGDVGLVEGVMRIIATIAYFEDGCDLVFGDARMGKVLVRMLGSAEISGVETFRLFMRNLKSNTVHWKMVEKMAKDQGHSISERIREISEGKPVRSRDPENTSGSNL